MIRFLRAPVASSVQDLGRFGHRARGHARSGAMDPASLRCANILAGAPEPAAGVELGPGPCELEVFARGTIAFAGAPRDGAGWLQTLEVRPGDTFSLSPARRAVWSYLALGGGIETPEVLGSRATCVREGIGTWLRAGDTLTAANGAREPVHAEPPALSGPVRLFGSLEGDWRVGARADRMGYTLDGPLVRGAPADEWSEPMLPGFVQIPPGGAPIVLMPEGPTVGGYGVVAAVHSDDLRLIAQTPATGAIRFVSV